MVQIIMTVETSSCKTNVGEVRAILDGGSCRIDWGDGTDLPYKPEGQDLHAQHTYPEKSEKEEATFVIRIYSDEENIIGIYAECGDIKVKDIDISGCQSLRYFASLQPSTEHFDLKTNPGILKIDLECDYDGIADLSNSVDLRELSVNLSFVTLGLYILDLSKCDKLEKLELISILVGFRIKLPNIVC